MFRFTIRDVVWLTVVLIGSGCGLVVYRNLEVHLFHSRVIEKGQAKMIEQLQGEIAELKQNAEP